MLYSLFEHYRGGSLDSGLKVHDACAIAYLLRPELFTTEEKYIEIATEGVAAGAMVSDIRITTHAHMKPNAKICTEVKAEEFEQWFVDEFCQ